MTPIVVMEAMGWSYNEYLQCPVYVLEDLIAYLNERGRISEQARKKAARRRY